MTDPELVPQPLVGFRFWSVLGNGKIGPQNHNQWKVWPDDGRMSSSVPRLDKGTHNHHGVHAYYTPKGTWQLPCPRVAGAIVAWGWVIEHEVGFRAQHAKIIAVLPLPPTVVAEETAERYGVPLLPVDELVAYCRWWGEVRVDGKAHV